MIVELTRVRKWGGTIVVVLNKQIQAHTCWKAGDSIVVRAAGEKLIMQRVPTEELAKLRTGELEPAAVQTEPTK